MEGPELDERLTEAIDRGFDAPWQARAVALAVETVDRLGLEWDDFRTRLMDEVAAHPDQDHYASWIAALESLVADADVAAPDDLAERRLAAARYATHQDGHPVEVVALSPDLTVVAAVLADIAEQREGSPTSIDGCRHLEIHLGANADGAVRAYGLDAALLCEIEVAPALADELIARYAGASTWPAPTIESLDTIAASSSASSPSVPDGRSGSTK